MCHQPTTLGNVHASQIWTGKRFWVIVKDSSFWILQLLTQLLIISQLSHFPQSRKRVRSIPKRKEIGQLSILVWIHYARQIVFLNQVVNSLLVWLKLRYLLQLVCVQDVAAYLLLVHQDWCWKLLLNRLLYIFNLSCYLFFNYCIFDCGTSSSCIGLVRSWIGGT